MNGNDFSKRYFEIVSSTCSFTTTFLHSRQEVEKIDKWVFEQSLLFLKLYFPLWLLILALFFFKLGVLMGVFILGTLRSILVKIVQILLCQRRFGNTNFFKGLLSNVKKLYTYNFYFFTEYKHGVLNSILYIIYASFCFGINYYSFFYLTISEYKYILHHMNFEYHISFIVTAFLISYFFLFSLLFFCLNSMKKAIYTAFTVILALNILFIVCAWFDFSFCTQLTVNRAINAVYFSIFFVLCSISLFKTYKYDKNEDNWKSFFRAKEMLALSGKSSIVSSGEEKAFVQEGKAKFKLKKQYCLMNNKTLVTKFTNRRKNIFLLCLISICCLFNACLSVTELVYQIKGENFFLIDSPSLYLSAR